jgi:hypothetical protein
MKINILEQMKIKYIRKNEDKIYLKKWRKNILEKINIKYMRTNEDKIY